MIHIAAVLIYLGVAFLVYRRILRKQEGLSLTKKAYVGTLLNGALPCTICIMIFELLFDRFILNAGTALWENLVAAFFRAALIEEFFKYLFSKAAIKKHKPLTKIEYMLLCGMVGAGYGILEKLAMGGGAILIVNAFLPLHIFFQFCMGAYLYKAQEARLAGDIAESRKNALLAYFVPFLIHGTWDALLDTAGYMVDDGGMDVPGFLLLLGTVVFGFIAEIKVIKKMAAMPCESLAQTEE